MNFDDTIRTTARIEAVQNPARLDRARHMREAPPITRQRSRLAWQIGKWLNHAGSWLQGLPIVPEAPRSPGQITLADIGARHIGKDDGDCRPEPPTLVFGERRLS